jgi:hypothetical protein
LFIFPCVSTAAVPEPTGATAQVTRGNGVTVQKSEPLVQRKTFDSRNPPPDMPALGPRADAITEPKFGCTAAVYSSFISRARDESGKCTVTKRIESVEVHVDLTVTIWTPTWAKQKLIDHEEGHREIAERVYGEIAAAAARSEAEKLVGKTITASGDDCEAAAAAAVKEAVQAFSRAYMDATADWASRVGNRYDEITRHGKRDEPNVEEAIRQAFEREPREKPRAREEQAREQKARG